MRAFLVDDHHLFRDALRTMLEAEGDIIVGGDASRAEEALTELARGSFDVVLVDLNLPGHDGVWLTREIGTRWPELPVLILSMRDDEDSVLQALNAGAKGFLVKTARQSELKAALIAVQRGGSYFCGDVAGTLLSRLRNEHPPAPALTEREQNVLRLLVDGLSNVAIGKSLHLSVSRVKVHVSELFRKFSVSERTSLAAEATNRRAL